MPYSNSSMPHRTRPAAWSRFLIGIFCLVAVVYFFTRGATPPGVFGDVIRHNRAAAIDATPIFYSEVENIMEIQAGLAEWWHRADTVQDATMEAPGSPGGSVDSTAIPTTTDKTSK